MKNFFCLKFYFFPPIYKVAPLIFSSFLSSLLMSNKEEIADYASTSNTTSLQDDKLVLASGTNISLRFSKCVVAKSEIIIQLRMKTSHRLKREMTII